MSARSPFVVNLPEGATVYVVRPIRGEAFNTNGAGHHWRRASGCNEPINNHALRWARLLNPTTGYVEFKCGCRGHAIPWNVYAGTPPKRGTR